MLDDPRYTNSSRPASIPVRSGTDSYPVQARLVTVDGAEYWTAATVVRHAPGHVMCRLPAPNGSAGYGMSARAEYLWLANQDVLGSQNPT